MHKTTRLKTPLTTLLLLLLFLISHQLFAQEDEYLLPKEAFQLSASADGGEHILVNWKIAEGYYLYSQKIKLASESEGIELAEVVLPKGKIKEDEFFGQVETYRDQVQIRVPLKRGVNAGDTLVLKTVSQGCADAGLCYPPQTERVNIALPTVATPSQGNSLQALAGLGNSLGLNEEPDIPSPDQAFQFNAEVASGEQLRLLWQILDGTYLYQDQIKLSLLNGDGVVLGDIQMPPADIKQDAIRLDGTIGDLPVYHNQIDLPVPLKRSNTAATDITLQVKYQGCAEAGVCYPPITRNITLSLPAIEIASAAPIETQAATQPSPSSTAPAPAAEEPITEQDQIAATLANSNTGLVILSFFGFGLLLSLTPCVFPMIPILSGIIAGHGTNISVRKGFTLSMVYVQAMALTYTAVGVLAGLSGANLQAAFQNPWILISFALVFVLLALSMFGFYDLQLPSKWQSKLTEASNKQQGGSMAGVAVMGLLSALIVGPCVAPPLFGALIYIGQTGDAVLGGVALYALSMGMGAPLLAIGTSAGKLLPRAGAWMDAVKAVFGVGLLAVAIVMLERIVPAAVAMVLWGALLIASAIYMGALQQLPVEASGWKRLWKGIGVVLLVYGALMLVGAAAGGKDTVQPLRGLGFGGGAGGAGEAQHLSFKRIKSVDDLNREVAAASAAGKPTMLDFYADWCVSCKEMERYTFSDPAVINALEGVVLLQADVTANDEVDQALMQGHFGIPGPPSIMFYGRDGQERKNYRVVGFMDAEKFAPHVQKAIN
ncbi:MAG: protein-disulfide reductase DsbD [Chromatiales bacterium]|nr:protein-disulfide reductase DsbD [Chromatiales bacterium]